MSTVTASQSVCARIADRLAASVGQRKYRIWFDRSARLSYQERPPRLDVAVPNQFIADWIGRHFEHALLDAVRQEGGEQVDLNVCVDPDCFETQSRQTAKSPPRRPRDQPAGPPQAMRPQILRHRLDSFIVGPSNELAYTAGVRLIADEDHTAVSPLFLHGGCGLGKTHLLQGICRRMLEVNPNATVYYSTAEQFTNEYLMAVRTNGMDAFRKRIRRLDLLAVDDVHFLANKQATQQEFLHSFDAIHLSGSRLALASDNHPKLIKQFSEQLVNRCMRGMVVQVSTPDTDTRVRIIRSLSADRGLSLLDSVIDAMANHCRGSVREIEGTLTKLHALAKIVDQRRTGGSGDGQIGHALLNRLLQSETQAPRKPVRIQSIVEVVCRHMRVSTSEVLGRGRRRDVVLARALLIHLARLLTAMSYPEIAAQMNRSSHSTVVTAARRMERQLAENPPVTVPGTLESVPLSEWVERIKAAVIRA